METDKRLSWPGALFFVFSGIIFTFMIYHLVWGAINPALHWGTTVAPSNPTAREPIKTAMTNPGIPDHNQTDNVILNIGQEWITPKTKVVYQGTGKKGLRFAYYILQLDPHYAYHRNIPRPNARRGFSLGEEKFKLIAERWNRINLERIN